MGTQNYTSTASSTYKLLGAMADFFLQNGTTVVGQHFFLSNGAGGFNPVFTKTDASVSCLPTRTHTFGRAMGQPSLTCLSHCRAMSRAQLSPCPLQIRLPQHRTMMVALAACLTCSSR